MRFAALAVGAACLPLSAAQAFDAVPSFERVEVADHIYAGGWEHFVGGGVAVFDCTGDGRPELYAAGGTNPAQLFVNSAGGPLSFVADTPAPLALTGVTGAYPINIDGDAHTDLVVLRLGPDQVLRGLGNCAFEAMEVPGLADDDAWTTAFSATWEGDNALPTLAFGTYIDRTDPDGPFEACDAPRLYRLESAEYASATLLEPGFCALSILFSDWARTGRADLRVSNDRHYYVRGGREQLWAMEETPREYTADEGWAPLSIWGMGIASRDLTGDGAPEVYLTSMGDQKYQISEGDPARPTWRDATYDFGTTAHRPHVGSDGRPSTGWHAQFGDVTNDGRDDIFVAKGNVEQMPVAAMEDPNTLLIQGADGQFTEAAGEAGIASMARGRGAALADLDGDGLLDLVVINRRAAMEVYRNTTTNPGRWLSVDLQQPAPNVDAVGAFIEVRGVGVAHLREVTIGGGHAGGQDVPEHFGMAAAKEAEVRVIWPDGATLDWQTVPTNAPVTIKR
ncbi:MAG: CRTAC1 family protein [Pseudomonadota bacterium]